MKAYEVPRNTMIFIDDPEVMVPPDALNLSQGEKLKVLNLDGMYVNCLNEDGERVYLAAWTEVSICG